MLVTQPVEYEGHNCAIDIWMLAKPDFGPAITVVLPHGRSDIAEFMVRSLRAGQNCLVQLAPGEKFEPDLRCPFPERAH
jgi:hypothetical protein